MPQSSRNGMFVGPARPRLWPIVQLPSPWYTVVGIGVAWFAVLAVCWPTVRTLLDAWIASRTFRHGLLIWPATLYLLWSYRERLHGVSPARSLTGTIFCVLLGLIWAYASVQEHLLGQQIAVVAMLPAIVWALAGTRVFRLLCFPLCFVFLSLPVGMAAEAPLQDFTAAMLVLCFKAIGVPVTQDGYILTLPSGHWEVAPDCAGLRYVLPGLALGYMYTAAMYRQAWRRAAFLSLSLVLLVLANEVRAFSIIFFDLVGVVEGTDHRVFSYTVYGITIAFLAWVGTTWADDPPMDDPAPASGRCSRP